MSMPNCQDCQAAYWSRLGSISEFELETHYCPYCYDVERQDYSD